MSFDFGGGGAPPDSGPPTRGGFPDISTWEIGKAGVYEQNGIPFLVNIQGNMQPYDPKRSADRYINLGNGRLYDTTTGQTVDAGGAGGASYVHTTERLIDPNQIEVERVRAQNQIDIANLQNAAANARTDAEKQNYLAQAAAKQREQQFSEFKYLSDLASNPRNFMQSFFLHRGFQPPAGAGGFGNTSGGVPGAGGGLPLPPFLGGGTPAGGGPAAPVTSASGPGPGNAQFQPGGLPTGTTPGANPQQPSSMLPTTGLRDPASINAVGGSSGYSALGNAPAPVQTIGYDPVAHAAAQRGGASYAYSGAPVNPNPGTNIPFNMAPILGAPGSLGTAENPYVGTAAPNRRLQALARGDDYATGGMLGYAHGGITPEPIMGVGMHSNPELFQALHQAPGHKYLIGEHGAEGVVPASYLPKFLQSRHGQEAVGGQTGNLASSDALVGTNVGGMGTTYGQGGTLTYGDGGMIGPSHGASGGDLMAMWANGGRLGAPPQSGPGGDAMAMFAQGGPLGMPNRQMQGAMRTPLSGSLMDGGAVGVNSDITAMADGGEIGQPSDTNPYGDDPNSPYKQLQSGGYTPPFLQRAMQQGQGNQAYGTNMPQKAYLPPGLPLVSQLGFNQMSPSEQQALQSYASSFGVTPEDYLAQIEQQTAAHRSRQRVAYESQ